MSLQGIRVQIYVHRMILLHTPNSLAVIMVTQKTTLGSPHRPSWHDSAGHDAFWHHRHGIDAAADALPLEIHYDAPLFGP